MGFLAWWEINKKMKEFLQFFYFLLSVELQLVFFFFRPQSRRVSSHIATNKRAGPSQNDGSKLCVLVAWTDGQHFLIASTTVVVVVVVLHQDLWAKWYRNSIDISSCPAAIFYVRAYQYQIIWLFYFFAQRAGDVRFWLWLIYRPTFFLHLKLILFYVKRVPCDPCFFLIGEDRGLFSWTRFL